MASDSRYTGSTNFRHRVAGTHGRWRQGSYRGPRSPTGLIPDPPPETPTLRWFPVVKRNDLLTGQPTHRVQSPIPAKIVTVEEHPEIHHTPQAALNSCLFPNDPECLSEPLPASSVFQDATTKVITAEDVDSPFSLSSCTASVDYNESADLFSQTSSPTILGQPYDQVMMKPNTTFPYAIHHDSSLRTLDHEKPLQNFLAMCEAANLQLQQESEMLLQFENYLASPVPHLSQIPSSVVGSFEHV